MSLNNTIRERISLPPFFTDTESHQQKVYNYFRLLDSLHTETNLVFVELNNKSPRLCWSNMIILIHSSLPSDIFVNTVCWKFKLIILLMVDKSKWLYGTLENKEKVIHTHFTKDSAMNISPSSNFLCYFFFC